MPAIAARHVSYRYGDRLAVGDLSLEIAEGEVFAFLGPNGSGKTTLFRLLSTLIPLQQGEIAIFGHDLRRETTAVRRQLGVVFQSPSLDKKLTVAENLRHQGRLYGLSTRELESRRDELLGAVGLTDRAHDLVETLSGGMRRRVELAKSMLHRPRLLLLDEPSTGLDPGARSDLWKYLRQVREREGTTIVLTTHLLDEADRADRIAIMHQGKLVALDRPDALRAELGGDAITIKTERPAELAAGIRERFQCESKVIDGALRLEQADGHQWIARLVEAFPADVQMITLGKPTLEDVFIARTGHRFFGDASGEENDEGKKTRRKKR
ncbi:ABC transporter ATP-binding protein [Lacipirellula limnantheis]|uniref:Daunorubicin/doxorubicin resistance ATP-binding protein DrrA n=1 Tax=Lacipirellula limnantheis TaxID=2528024 RepID=A0A517U313_9BACT|nr:ABC transporter ATP-binding protein [Lacipirellula limnantheis]QDT75015.1 Daunorubicin/doxorubicin resistance ATP-binding protein DrrA [Lacipirellula limnantheis]